MFFEISALNGQNVQNLFNEVAKKLTGISTDLVKQNAITANQGFGQTAGSSPATDIGPQNPGFAPQNDNRGFHLGQR